MLRTEKNRRGEYSQTRVRMSGNVLRRGTCVLGPLFGPRIPVLVMAMFVVAMTLSACGFQLRGQAVIPFQTLRVETPGFSAFANELESAIRSGSKARIVDTRDEAEAVIQIVGELQERHILALSGGGKVREFELRYRVAYRFTDRAGVDLALPGEIVLRRDMTYDDTLVLAKESEELLLFRDLRTDAVRQMLRRLSVVRPAT